MNKIEFKKNINCIFVLPIMDFDILVSKRGSKKRVNTVSKKMKARKLKNRQRASQKRSTTQARKFMRVWKRTSVPSACPHELEEPPEDLRYDPDFDDGYDYLSDYSDWAYDMMMAMPLPGEPMYLQRQIEKILS